jgi:DNA polymerase III epsilon subunit-like protein
MPKIVSLDLETTGVRVDTHDVWEVGIVPLDSGRDPIHMQFQPVDLSTAEAQALEIGGFYERFDWIGDARFVRDMTVDGVIVDEEAETESPDEHKAILTGVDACWKIAKELEGATLLGLNVGTFDAPFLEKLLKIYGHAPTWRRRFLELGSFAAGAWGAKIPLSGQAIADRLERHDVQNRGAHNAYNDALWNVDAYNFILNGSEA